MGISNQTFYALLRDPPVTKPDLWKERKTGEAEIEEPITGRKDHVYFVINTAVGVGGKGMDRVKMVHIRFRLIPMSPYIRDPEVISIYPHSISERAGLIKISEETEKALAASGKSPSGFWAGLSIMFGKKLKKSKDYARPYHVIVANASGTGNRALWEFYQEEGMAAIGCFDLKIYFRILKKDLPPNWEKYDIIRDRYCIDWNVEVNGRRLRDHDIDFYSDWDIKVNGRCLMDKQLTNHENRDDKLWSDLDDPKRNKLDKKYYNYWNRSVQNGTNENVLRRSLSSPLRRKPKKRNPEDVRRDPSKQEVTYWMNEEDSKAEPQKLLRPLYLLPTILETRRLYGIML